MKANNQTLLIKLIRYLWMFATVVSIGFILTKALHVEAATQETAMDFKTNRPTLAVELFTKGFYYQQQGKLEEALEVYKQVLTITPDDETIYNNLGMIHQQLGQLNRALIYYEESLLRNPKYTKALNNKGLVYMTKKNWQKAEDVFLQSIAMDVNQPESYTNLAILYKKMNRTDDSFGMLNQVLAIYPRYAPAFYYLGQNYEERGLLLQARINYEQFLRFSKNNSLKWIVKKHLQSLHQKKQVPLNYVALITTPVVETTQEGLQEYPFDIQIKPLIPKEMDTVAANYEREQAMMNYTVILNPKLQKQTYTVFLEVVAHVRHSWQTEMLGDVQSGSQMEKYRKLIIDRMVPGQSVMRNAHLGSFYQAMQQSFSQGYRSFEKELETVEVNVLEIRQTH